MIQLKINNMDHKAVLTVPADYERVTLALWTLGLDRDPEKYTLRQLDAEFTYTTEEESQMVRLIDPRSSLMNALCLLSEMVYPPYPVAQQIHKKMAAGGYASEDDFFIEMEKFVYDKNLDMRVFYFPISGEVVNKRGLVRKASDKGLAESNIFFYRQEIINVLNQKKLIHSYQAADKLKSKLDDSFRFYQLSVYLHSYASFLEVVLSGNSSKDYLDHMSEKIQNYAFQYRKDYTECYDQLENYMKGTVQATALSGIGNASKAAGEAIAKMPLISKGPVDEALVAVGNKIKGIGAKHGKAAMRDFRDNRDVGIQLFLNSIDTINEVSNRPVELLFDQENIYICA